MNHAHDLRRRIVVALLALGLLLALLPSHAARGAAGGRAVTDGSGTAAIIGIVTRIPAEVTGGALYASSSVNLDKARARASGFYGGKLVDTFMRSSLEQYGPLNDELDATAENPQQSSPEEEVVLDSPDTGHGRVGHLRASTPDRRTAEAVFTMGSDSGGDGPFTFDASTAETRTRVLEDDTVVVRSVSTITGLTIADVVEFGTVRSVARIAVGVGQEPRTTFRTRIEGITVAGEEVLGVGDDGITLAGQALLEDPALTDLDPVFEQLAEQGLTFEAVPALVEAEAGRARIEGAAFRFRYQAKKNPQVAEVLDANPVYQFLPAIPPELGYDEEFLVGHVTARAVARDAGDLDIDLGFGGDDLPSADAAAPTRAEAPTDDEPSPASTAPTTTEVGSATPPAAPTTATAPEPTVAAPATVSDRDAGASGAGVGDTLELLGARAPRPGVERVTGAYRLLFLFGLAGAAAPRLLRRATS